MAATLIQNGSCSDAELVAESRRGSRDAFGQIVRRYQGMVTGVIYSFCGDLHRSEELAQDTFISAWISLSGITDPEKLSPWLCQIAHRKALDAVRARSREKNRLTHLFRLPPRPAPTTPPQDLLANEERELLWRILSELPQPYRQTLVLYYRQAKSAAAVALAMETTEEAVRQRLTRGREMLREQVAQTLERHLVRSAPAPTFAVAVLAALPIQTIAPRASAAVAGAVTREALPAKTFVASSLGGFILGLLGGLFGAWISPKTNSPRERRLLMRMAIIWWLLFFALVCLPGTLALAGLLPLWTLAACLGVLLIFQVPLLLWFKAGQRRMQAEERACRGPGHPPTPLTRQKIYGGVGGGIIGATGWLLYQAWLAEHWVSFGTAVACDILVFVVVTKICMYNFHR